MSDKPIEIEFDNKEVHEKLLNLAKRTENLRPLMKNIAGIFSYSTEENFKEEGRPDKWVDLAESTKKQRTKKRKWPGQILQVEGKLAASINTYYDNDSAVIGSNLEYAAIHQLGKHPRGSTKEETNSLADMLEDMVQDAIAVIPDDSSIEIQEASKSSSAEIYEKLIDKMNTEISKAILGQTLTTEIGSTGSYAASNTHMQVRQDIIDSDKKLVEGVINQLIQWIYEINFANAEVPVFELYEPENVDLNLAQRDKILSDTGVKFTKEYFIKNYGLEEEDFDIREDIIPASPNFKEFKEEEEKLVPGQAQIENLFKFITEGDLNKQAQSMLSPLIKLFESCENYEEAFELLTDKNLRSKQFEQTIQKALFLCELQGRADGLDED